MWVYTIEGQVRRKTEGGATGSVLTGDNTRLYMMRWDHKYKLKLKNLGTHLKMFISYVYDTVVVAKAINKGWRYCSVSNKMIYSNETFDSDNIRDKVRTAMTQSKITDSLNSNIQFTWDIPEQNTDFLSRI